MSFGPRNGCRFPTNASKCGVIRNRAGLLAFRIESRKWDGLGRRIEKAVTNSGVKAGLKARQSPFSSRWAAVEKAGHP